jgi:ASC-1-like (ASCH) protein
VCDRDDVLTVVKRVTCYSSFEEMLDGERPEKINPAVPATSNWPTSAVFTARIRKTWAHGHRN